MARLAHPLVVLAVSGLLAGGAAAPCASRESVRVTLLSVNDVYALEPSAEGRGGLARLVETLLDAVERRRSTRMRTEDRIRLHSSGVSP